MDVVNAKVTSHKEEMKFNIMTKTCELMMWLDELKTPLHLPPINLDKAYDFTSFFLHQSIWANRVPNLNSHTQFKNS
jgi:hypothetical protein